MIAHPRLSRLLYPALFFILMACQAPATPVPRESPTSTDSPIPTRTPIPTNTAVPTPTVEPTATPDPFPDPTIQIVGEEEVVFDWSKDRCEAYDIPDLPVRAFRDDQGNVQMISAHFTNRRFIGSSLNTIKHDCTPIMKSESLEDPSLYSYHQWLSSPYTEDGKTVYALVHNEYYGSEELGRCPPGDAACWYNAVTLAVSTDGGTSYHAAAEPPNHLIAGAPEPFEKGAGPYGFFEPSNIIKGQDGYYYAYLREHFYHRGGNVAEVCVMRTIGLSDASSWRAWDGNEFSVSFINPYLKPDEAKSARRCQGIPTEPGLGLMHQSIRFSTYLNRYVMVGNSATTINGRTIWGIMYSFSNDLVHWEPRKVLIELELPWTYQPGDPDYYLYPSLLDPDSPSRNFDTTGKRAYLYLTRFNKNTSSNPLNRDLVRIPVEFFPTKNARPAGTTALAWDFGTAGDVEGWLAWNQLAPLQVSGGHLVTRSSGNDPYMGSPGLNVDAMALPLVEIAMKVSAGVTAQVFFITDSDSNYDEAKSLRFDIRGDGEFHTYSLDMSKVPGWKGTIRQIRLDPTETRAAIEIDYIRLQGR